MASENALMKRKSDGELRAMRLRSFLNIAVMTSCACASVLAVGQDRSDSSRSIAALPTLPEAIGRPTACWSSGSNLYVTGARGVARYDGARWADMNAAFRDVPMFVIRGRSDSDIYAAGAYLGIQHWNGREWQQEHFDLRAGSDEQLINILFTTSGVVAEGGSVVLESRSPGAWERRDAREHPARRSPCGEAVFRAEGDGRFWSRCDTSVALASESGWTRIPLPDAIRSGDVYYVAHDVDWYVFTRRDRGGVFVLRGQEWTRIGAAVAAPGGICVNSTSVFVLGTDRVSRYAIPPAR